MKNEWLTIDNGILVKCSKEAKGEIIIPEGVTSIGNEAFEDCKDLISIEIPNSVTNIGKYAFYCCENLTSIKIPNSVINIENDAFNGCINLNSISIPNSVTHIGSSAFYDCISLETMIIPNSITRIGRLTFYGCRNLKTIIIPKSVTNIGPSAFFGCGFIENLLYKNISTGVIAYKGFTRDLICLDKQYELGKKSIESEAKICECGIHACLLPIEILNYYYHDFDIYYKVRLSGKFDFKRCDSKICATEMEILEPMSYDDLVRETIRIINEISRK